MRDRSFVLRLIAVLALVVLVFAACGKDEEPSSSTGGENESEDLGNVTLAHEGHLTVGSDIPYPPFEFEDASGNLTGFDVELTRAIADKLGLENDDNDWISTNFDTIFVQLQRGTRFDVVVAAVTGYAAPNSPAEETVNERLKLVDFTDPYYPSLQSVAVDTTKQPDVKGEDDLGGLRVAVQTGTTGAFYAKEKLTDSELVEFPKAPSMFQALQAGQVDAVFNDLPVSLDAIKGKPNLAVVQQVETGEQYAIAVNKKNSALKDAINRELADLITDGTYAEIFKKYFPDQELPSYAS